jgi:hypothetical protein
MATDEHLNQPTPEDLNNLLSPADMQAAFMEGGNEGIRSALAAAAYAKFGEGAMALVFGSQPQAAASESQYSAAAADSRPAYSVRERGEIGPERTPGDEVPTRPGDDQRGLKLAILGHHPVTDYDILAKSGDLALTRDEANTLRPSVGVAAGESDDLGVLRFFYTAKGVPAIGYGFRSLKAVQLRKSRSLAGVVVADDEGVEPGAGVTPELAVRLAAIDPVEEDPLKGWAAESVADPFGDVHPLNLAALKGTQERQREQVHERLKRPEVSERLITVIAAALENPVGKPGARDTLYMRRVDAPDAHAMLYGMLDMLSMSPELYDAVGGRWAFSTAVGEQGNKAGNFRDLRFMFSSYSMSSPPQDAGVSSIRRQPDSIYTKAATRLVSTFLNGHNIEQTAELIASTGKFDPQDPEAWCAALAA